MSRKWITILILGCVCGNIVECVLQTKIGHFTSKTEEVEFIDNGNTDRATVESYLGIPYAKPPVGKLRFVKSELFEGNSSMTYGSEFGNICYQEFTDTRPSWLNLIESEDCLFLNIYVPKKSKYPQSMGLPVMVFIHGDFGVGDFRSGASNFYPGQALAAQGDIIIVTLNYRLGHAGFLATLDAYDEGKLAFSGNYGLWDQHVALQWVNRNIGLFGGDPSKVTLAGQQTGAVCALYQAMYIGNKGLFNKVIAQSGSPVSEGSREMGPFYTKPNKVLNVAYLLCRPGISINDDDRLECMQGQNISNVMFMSKYYDSKTDDKNLPMTPVIDNDFIKADPKDILNINEDKYKDERDFFNSLEMLIGYNKDDGFQQTLYRMIANWGYPYDSDHLININYGIPYSVSRDMYEDPYGASSNIINKIESLYKGIPEGKAENESIIAIKFATDYVFVQPAVNLLKYRRAYLDSLPSDDHNNTIRKESGAFKTYAYEFNGRSHVEMNIAPRPLWFNGTGNGYELPFLFGFYREMLDAFQTTGPSTTSRENALSTEMMTLWSTFVRSGFSGSSLVGSPVIEWPSVFDLSNYNSSTGKWNDPFHLPYLEFNLWQPTNVKYNFAGDHAEVWDSFDELFGMEFDTAEKQTSKGSKLAFHVVETMILLMIMLLYC